MSDAAPDGPSRAGPRPRPNASGKVRKRHTVGKVLLATVVVLGLVTGLGVVYLYRHLNGNLQVLDPTDQLVDRPGQGRRRGRRSRSTSWSWAPTPATARATTSTG